jgi:hypothetical protein
MTDSVIRTPEAEGRISRKHRATLAVEGPDLWCGITIQLPMYLEPGDTYTLVWVWDFAGI